MIPRCPNGPCGGAIVGDEDGRLVCLLCGHVAHDPATSIGERLLKSELYAQISRTAPSPDLERGGGANAPDGLEAAL